MMRYRIGLLAALLALPVSGFSQTCPKVAYTTTTPTLKSLVASVNCLVGAEKTKASHGESTKGLQVESFPVIGPQHTRIYHRIVVALLSVPAGNAIKTALASSESPEATVAGTAGAECKVKINSDRTVDGQCNQTGGTLYVVYQN